jgi:hypothetical protein
MSLIPQDTEITGDLSEVLGKEHTIRRDGWTKAMKLCSRVTVSFFCKSGSKQTFFAQVRLFERGGDGAFYKIDMSIKRAEFHAQGPDYCLNGSLKYSADYINRRRSC